MRFDLICKVMHVHHGTVDARLRDPVEHMIEERPAGESHERLRNEIGQRPHARALARGQHHCGLNLSARIRPVHSLAPISARLAEAWPSAPAAGWLHTTPLVA